MDVTGAIIEMVVYFLKIYLLSEFLIIPLERIVRHTCNIEALKYLLLSIIGTIQLCILNYQITAVTPMDAPIIFAIGTFVVMPLWLVRWGGVESSANVILEFMLVNKRVRKNGIFIILAKMLSGYIAFKVMQVIWKYRETGYTSVGCSAIFNKDSLLHAFIIEWILTIIHRLVIYIIVILKKYWSTPVIILMHATALTIFRTIGFFTIGSFNDPILGYCVRFGCSEIDNYQNILVYWVAPFCGSLCALFVFHGCYQLIIRLLEVSTGDNDNNSSNTRIFFALENEYNELFSQVEH